MQKTFFNLLPACLTLLSIWVAACNESNRDVRFLRKKYDDLSQTEIKELDELAGLLGQEPGIGELLNFYYQSSTLKINSMLDDPYIFVFIDQQEKTIHKD